MRNLIQKFRPATALALFAGVTLALLAPQASAQTFDTVLGTNLFQPAGVSISPLNHYVISDTADHRIVDFNADNRVFKVLAGPDRAPFEPGAVDGQGIDARFRNPQGILCVGDRTYVADSGNHVIREIDSAGNVRTIAGNLAVAHEVDDFGGMPSNWGFVDGPVASAQFNGPSALATDGKGHLYIADSGNRAIRMLDLNNGTVSTIVRSGLVTPVGLALSETGIFISDTGAHSIKVWHPGDTKATLVAGGGSPLARGYRDSSIATNALFSGPAGIYYRELTDELIVADSGNGVLRTVQGVSGTAPKVDTFANTAAAGLQTPIAVTRDLYGVFLVCDSTRNALESVITVRFPRIEQPQVGYIIIVIDSTTGLPEAKLVPVTDSTFDNLVRIAISGDPTAQHRFTQATTLTNSVEISTPTTNSTAAQNFAQPIEPAPPEDFLNGLSINGMIPPRYNFHLKVFSTPKGEDERIPSLVTESYFRFKCGSPQIDSQAIPGRLLFRCSTTNAVVYYTMDGSDPIKGTGSAQLVRNGDSIPLIVTTNTIKVKARAYMDDRFIPSDLTEAEFSPDNFIPNRISLGFQDGEASSLMRAAPGQRYFAPVTLSLMPNAKAYGLQFDLNLEPLSAPLSSDYKMKFNSTFIEQTDFTNRIIPPSVFVLTGTNYVTNFVDNIATNYTYAITFTNSSTGPSTNFVVFTNKLPDVVPVVTTTLVTNLGTFYPVSVTNYVTNSFQLVSGGTVTNRTDEPETTYLYRYVLPSTTNLIHRDASLPDSTPVVITNFVSNMGQVFPVTVTNILTNAFDLISKSFATNPITTLTTDFVYQAVSPGITNIVAWNDLLPDKTLVLVTNFLVNLGKLFPVVATNYISNAFNLLSKDTVTNTTTKVSTNFDYRAVVPDQTSYLTLNSLLPDRTPVVLTNFLTNMGKLYPLTSTNYVSNSFDLVSVTLTTNPAAAFSTNYIYEAGTLAQTNILVLDRILPDTTAILTTNLIANMGQNYPILTTNYVSNAFNLVSSTVSTNTLFIASSNYLYEVSSPAKTNIVVLDYPLPNQAEIHTTNFIPNLGDLFPVIATNYINNNFNLLSIDRSTNVETTISTNFAYRTVTPGKTNLITLQTLLPDSIPVVVTNLVSNLGQQFPVVGTNYITNAFDLVSSAFTTNIVSNTSTSYLYRSISTAVTNYVTIDHFFPDPGPVVTSIGATNLGNTYILSSTNIVPSVFEFVSATITTNVLNTLSYEYGYDPLPWVNDLRLPTPLPDFSTVITTNTFSVTNQANGAILKFPVNTTNTITSADLSEVVFNDAGNPIYHYAIVNLLPAGKFTSPAQITFATNISIQATGYIPELNQTYTEQFVTFFPPVITSTDTNTLVTVDIKTNATYRLRSPILTNYITLSTNLPDVAPVVSQVTITNEGQNFTFAVTNYATNTFELVLTSTATTVRTNLSTNAVYALRTPAVTNIINLTTNLPDTAPIVSTTFVTNLGQLFPVTTTNFVANTFEFIGETHKTTTETTVRTNVVYGFIEPQATNYVLWPELLPAVQAVLTTNLISNLGRQFPVIQTNYVTNTFRLVSSDFVTNYVPIVATNVVYEFRTSGTSTFVITSELLPDQAPIVTTNFISNLGRLFPVISTNYLTNNFRLVGSLVETNSAAAISTSVMYAFTVHGSTNYMSLTNILQDFVPVVTTTFLTNLGQIFTLRTTNYEPNTFEFLGERHTFDVQTNIETSVLYQFITPGVTNYVILSSPLPNSLTVVTTNFISNLGQSYPVLVTNVLQNSFVLLYTNLSSNTTFDIKTDVLYQLRTPSVTNLFELDQILPAFVQVITTNFVTNLNALFPVKTTNVVANLFDLISTNVSTNTVEEVTGNYLYAVVSQGGGAIGQPNITTNFVTMDTPMRDVVPVVNFLGYVDNQGTLYPVYSTNYMTNTFRLVSTGYLTNTMSISTTNVPDAFQSLVITNYAQNWLAVGWVETYGRTNLYNTIQHDLLQLSMPHTTTFVAKNGEAVAGSFSFIVPTNAASGDQYKVRVSRPSATADGINLDMFIQAPEEDDAKSPVKAVKTLTVTNRLGYVVGDVSNFRWFNAGEFGDGDILNNDITELQRVIIYGLNVPPEDSDFLDAMDTCCFTDDGQDLSNIQFASSSIDLDRIAFGEGSRYAPLGRRPLATLAVNDLYVAFRRSLDPDLNWYQRYWSNGTRQATIIPNTFRGKTGAPLGRQSVSASSVPVGPTIQSSQAPALTLFAGTASGLPGIVVAVPIHARVEGGYPVRALMFSAHVESPDGTAIPASSLEVVSTDALGEATYLLNDEPGRSGVAWLDTSKPGILGDQVVGRLLFTIPADAKPTSLYYVKLERVSGSPNGVSLFPVRSGNGVIALANRPTAAWNDGIPDAWRMQYFGTLNDVRSAADADADGDGLSNYEEYKLGTNPMDPNDNLRVHAAANGRGVKLRFRTATGKMYQIEASANLEPGTWLPVLSNVAGTGNDIELPDSGGAHSFYYRIRLQE